MKEKVSIYKVNDDFCLDFITNFSFQDHSELAMRLNKHEIGAVFQIFNSEGFETFQKGNRYLKQISTKGFPASHELPTQAWY